MAAVHQAVFVQLDENPLHSRRVCFVERESRAGPIAGRANGLELVEDDPTSAIDVFPDAFYERFAPKIVAGLSLFRHELFHRVLGGDAGVVGTRQPLRFTASHPLESDEHVLDSVVQSVAHVEDVSHVGWWDDDDVGLAVGLRIGREDACIQPSLVNRAFDRRRVVLRWQGRFRHRWIRLRAVLVIRGSVRIDVVSPAGQRPERE